MVQELLPLLPTETSTLGLAIAIVGVLVGAGLWLVGARFSRTLMALAAVAVGGGLGMLLPRWAGWGVSSSASAVGGAIVLGVSGFAMHKVWVGLGLGTVLACWAALATWVVCDVGASWAWPPVDPSRTSADYLATVWRDLPERVRDFLPIACLAGMGTGLTGALLAPRIGLVLLYSTAGASLLVGMGIAAITFGRPEWIALVPAQTWAQVLTLAGLVAFGAVVQWRLAPTTAAGAPPPPKPKEQKDD
jgi:hypothetical protein